MRRRPIPVVCYDLPVIDRYLRSVALSVATQRYTKLVWKKHDESTVINAIYSVLFWKTPPGTVDIVQPRQRIRRTAAELHHRYMHSWFRKVSTEGPESGNEYIQHMWNLKQDCVRFTRSVYSDASAINRGIMGENADAIKTLAAIKLGARAGVAVLTIPAALTLTGTAAVVAFGVDAAQSASISMIQEWEKGDGAKAVAIAGSKDFAKNVLEEGIDKGGEAISDKAVASLDKADSVVKSMEGVVREQTRKVRQTRRATRKGKTARRHLRKAEKTLDKKMIERSNRRLRVSAAKGLRFALPVVFATMDINEAWQDFEKDIVGL